MRPVWLLLLLPLLAAGCVVPGAEVQIAAVERAVPQAVSEDVGVGAEAYPVEILAGREATVYFSLQNLQAFNISARLEVYDACGGLLVNQSNQSWADTVGPNKTRSWNWKYTADAVSFERSCEIRYRLNYTGQLRASQDIAVLSAGEYYGREQAGTLGEIPISSSSTANPLRVSLTFSEAQPFIDGSTVYAYLDYSDTGQGFLDRLAAGAISITPQNLAGGSCAGFSATGKFCAGAPADCSSFPEATCAGQQGCGWQGCRQPDCAAYTTTSSCEARRPACVWDIYKGVCKKGITCAYLGREQDCEASRCDWLGCAGSARACGEFDVGQCLGQAGCYLVDVLANSRNIVFINRRAPRSTCTFTARSDAPVTIAPLVLTASYDYVIDAAIPVRLKPRAG